MRFKWNNISSLDILSLMHPDRSVHSLIYYLHLYSNKIPLNTYDIVVDYFFFSVPFCGSQIISDKQAKVFFQKYFFTFVFFLYNLKMLVYWKFVFTGIP